MTYAECIALYPNAPAVYCLQVSGDMGQSSVAPPPVSTDGWQVPTALQFQAYRNNKGYWFCIKNIFGVLEYFAVHPEKRELINFSSLAVAKKMFPTFETPHQIANIDFVILPPTTPFGMIALSALNKNKIVRIIPGSLDLFEVMGYPPELSYLNPPPPSPGVYTPDEDLIPDDFPILPDVPDPAPPPIPGDSILPDGGAPASNNALPILAGIGLLFFILK
jgi:hypothetical protein